MRPEEYPALARLIRYVQNNPRRSLEVLDNGEVWLKDFGYSVVAAPSFEGIIAPTHDDGKPLFGNDD